jgi:hypothetical protein
VVTETVAVGAERLPAASTARTVYAYAVRGARPPSTWAVYPLVSTVVPAEPPVRVIW